MHPRAGNKCGRRGNLARSVAQVVVNETLHDPVVGSVEYATSLTMPSPVALACHHPSSLRGRGSRRRGTGNSPAAPRSWFRQR